MNKNPYFIHNADGTFTFLGYFDSVPDSVVGVVDVSFLYRTIDAAKDALNNMPRPEGCN